MGRLDLVTYTMGTGVDYGNDEDRKGILPRMISDLFERLDTEVEKCAKEGYSYEIYSSCKILLGYNS